MTAGTLTKPRRFDREEDHPGDLDSDPWAPPSGLSKPKPRVAISKRDAGGDNEVERDGMGRPRIIVKCDVCSPETPGKVPSEKVKGRLNKCPRCNTKGSTTPGFRKVSYTRVTTFIDALEDKENLMAWVARMVLVGVAMDTGFLKDVTSMDPENKEDKDTLNRRAEAAKELAGANKKADKGTYLHALSELVDQGLDLPDDVTGDDWLRVMAYAAATQPLLLIVLMEQLMVNDDLGTAGTPDRVSRIRDGVELIAPDGHVFSPFELIITDLKTGRIDYGGLKMCMQLALYARSKLYDKETGLRKIVNGINQKWGIIMHSDEATGETKLLWANLELGWQAVLLAREVRAMRSMGRKALTEFSSD